MPNVAIRLCVTFCNNTIDTNNVYYVKRRAKIPLKIPKGTLLPKKFLRPLNAPPNAQQKTRGCKNIHVRIIIMKDMQDRRLKFQKTLAKIIKSHRQELHLSMTESSHKINLTKSVWSELEAGNRDPQLSTIWRMAEALNIPLSKIIIELEQKLGKDFFSKLK